MLKNKRKKKAPSATRNDLRQQKTVPLIKQEEDSSMASVREVRTMAKGKRLKVLDDSQEEYPSPTDETKAGTKAARLTEDVNPITYWHSNKLGKHDKASPHFGVVEKEGE